MSTIRQRQVARLTPQGMDRLLHQRFGMDRDKLSLALDLMTKLADGGRIGPGDIARAAKVYAEVHRHAPTYIKTIAERANAAARTSPEAAQMVLGRSIGFGNATVDEVRNLAESYRVMSYADAIDDRRSDPAREAEHARFLAEQATRPVAQRNADDADRRATVEAAWRASSVTPHDNIDRLVQRNERSETAAIPRRERLASALEANADYGREIGVDKGAVEDRRDAVRYAMNQSELRETVNEALDAQDVSELVDGEL